MKSEQTDLLLIFPSLSEKERFAGKKVRRNAGGFLPPLGVLSLAAFLIEERYNVEVIEPILMDINMTQILNYIRKRDPKVIGISVLTSMYSKGIRYARKIKRQFPNKILLMGGHHITLFRKNTFKDCPSIDFLIFGEGELTLLNLMNFFRKKSYSYEKVVKDYKSLNKIKGIGFKEKKKIVITEPRELIPNLDILPFPARHLIPIDKCIPLPIEYKRLPVIHMMVSRGCPFNCTYCSTHAAFGHKARFRSPKKVIEEIKFVIKKYGARQISFWDDTLTINKKWMTNLCNLIINEKLDIIWNCYSHINTVDDSLLRKMKEAGCFCIWYGIESGNEDLLKIINKGTTLDSIRRTVRLTQKNGIEIRGLFMLALPGETPEHAKRTINFAKELDLDYAQFTATTPHIGTKLFEDAKRYGTLKVRYDEFTQQSAVFVPFGYKNSKEVEKMIKRANREFYFRPKYIFKHLRKIRSMEDMKRYLTGLRLAFAFS
ncbi:radical SAM protein [Candidatus Woesearchaeota archaeon]|nr:radical SAM protein [Candidatus Woesearchaeota archaeon]